MKRLSTALLLLALLAACAAPAGASTPGSTEAPTLTATPAPASAPAGTEAPTVCTNWSKLGARETPASPVGTRWYADYTDTLLPRDDYGMLVPYAGLRLMDDWPSQSGCLYGLMTADGRVVTDPVYSSVYRPGWNSGAGWRTHRLLVLSQGVSDSSGEDSGTPRYAVAALDGSWCTKFRYLSVTSAREGLLLLESDRMCVMSPDGSLSRLLTMSELGLSQEEYDRFLSEAQEFDTQTGAFWGGYVCLGYEGDESLRLFRLDTGETVVWPIEQWWRFRDSTAEPAWEISEDGGGTVVRRGEEVYTIAYPLGSGYAEVLGDLVVFQGSDSGGAVYRLDGEALFTAEPGCSLSVQRDTFSDSGGFLLTAECYGDETSGRSFYLPDGTFLLEFRGPWIWYRQVNLVGGLLEVLDWNTASYYDPATMACVFRTSLHYEGD